MDEEQDQQDQADYQQTRHSHRERTLTENGQEMYKRSVNNFSMKLHKLYDSIDTCIKTFSGPDTKLDITSLHKAARDILSQFELYCEHFENFITFLGNTRTEEGSIEQRNLQQSVMRIEMVKEKVDAVIHDINQLIMVRNTQEHVLSAINLSKAANEQDETQKHSPQNISVTKKSSLSGRSTKAPSSSRTNASSLLLQQRVKSETAKTRLKYAEMSAKLQQQKAEVEEEEGLSAIKSARKLKELDINLDLVERQCELEEAEAELNALYDEMESDINKSDLDSVVSSKHSNYERTNQYVLDQIQSMNLNTKTHIPASSGKVGDLDNQNQPTKTISFVNPPTPTFPEKSSVVGVFTSPKSSAPSMALNPTSTPFVPKSSMVGAFATPKSLAPPISLNPTSTPLLPKSSVCEATLTPQSGDMLVASELTKFLMKKDLLLSRLYKYNDQPENYLIWKSSFKIIMQDLGATVFEELDLLIKWLGPESSRHAIRLRASNVKDPIAGLERIWNRLDERYGSPELVESTLREKLLKFPKLTNKDGKRLYELADILSEIESIMDDPRYRTLLSYFDSSSGVNPIVNKLPPYLQSKWTDHAMRYKESKNAIYPPFSVFVEFIRKMSIRQNDPSFSYDSSGQSLPKERGFVQMTSPYTGRQNGQPRVSSRKTDVLQQKPSNELSGRQYCLIHGNQFHSLDQCKVFRSKPVEERKDMLKQNGICFKCLKSKHLAKDCQERVQCDICKSKKHPGALHIENPRAFTEKHSGEVARQHDNNQVVDQRTHVKEFHSGEPQVTSNCLQICGNNSEARGKSCAKTVLVKIYPNGRPDLALNIYAMIDDQSNRSLARSELFEHYGEETSEIEYMLSSCAGNVATAGRRMDGYVVESIDGMTKLNLPTLIECNQIPNLREEIPTPEIAMYYEHLQDIARYITPCDENAHISLLIGRDLIAAHHILDQRIGSDNAPYAQRLRLGWVIIGETCLGSVHKPDQITVNKTYVLRNGRTSLLKPCPNGFELKDIMSNDDNKGIGVEVFQKTPQDDNPGYSVEDKQFMEIMESGFTKMSDGCWSAPLPFKNNRPRLPNNFEQAEKRARSLEASLKNNPNKKRDFCEFMDQIFKNGHAELAPPLTTGEECWYLPIFGVYHPKKPGKIRVVFDSSAKFQGLSLNNVLLTGPDLTNSLLGILMRFRKDKVAITGDIEQMFFNFRVHEQHRNFLRFRWYEDNDPSKVLVDYRMRVHVFGNSPSPAVATLGLRKSACNHASSGEDCTEICDFVKNSFYVDDGLVSVPQEKDAISLFKGAQKVLMQEGQLRLHKIASNSKQVLDAFSPEDLATGVKDIDFEFDTTQVQRSLGLNWNILSDTFTYEVSKIEKPFTKRGVLSVVNSVFDPIGFVGPVVLGGKLILKNISGKDLDWDDPLPESLKAEWERWKLSLHGLENLQIPRTYASVSLEDCVRKELYIFSDASKDAIGAVAYLKLYDINGANHVGFVLGKTKVTPAHGHTIPRLELCAAVLAVEISDIISEELNISTDKIKFYTDSKVVLGYIHNETRRFYVYVRNRVDKIRKSTNPSQWTYVSTTENPADQGTRPVTVENLKGSLWLNGPPFLLNQDQDIENSAFDLIDPSCDKDVCPQVDAFKTYVTKPYVTGLGSDRFLRFSSWKHLNRAIVNLHMMALHYRKTDLGNCRSPVDMYKEAERHVIKVVQRDTYQREIDCISGGKPIPKDSTLLSLSPILDANGLLRVGGRLNRAEIAIGEKNPIIIPGKHHVATLLVRNFHESVQHQGRHITEGAIRSGGYWITGCKRLITSLLHNCVKCRKLRHRLGHQKMSDLPSDRLTPCPPFTFVGVDTFGPWTVVTRKTRGGQANSKRWAIMFSCLVSRGVHIEVVEELSSSAFINALRRFVSLRGPVKEFRSDRGTNFIGSTDALHIEAINVEDTPVKDYLFNSGVVWKFNAPHSSHMSGAWERMIGIARRILDSMLTNSNATSLTHEIFCTLMAEVCAIMNSRPLIAVSNDPEQPSVLSPSVLITQKTGMEVGSFDDISGNSMFKSQWQHVQVLANAFWKRWRRDYLSTLQHRQKWTAHQRNFNINDVVLLKDNDVPRNQWPVGVVDEVYPSSDGQIRKVSVRIFRDSKLIRYTRPISEIIYLLSE